jgi:hypothetical protein
VSPRGRHGPVAALAVLLGASAAAACPVCGLAASAQSQGAYIDMSIVISLLPLAAIGAIAGWVAFRVRAAARAEPARPSHARRPLEEAAPR